MKFTGLRLTTKMKERNAMSEMTLAGETKSQPCFFHLISFLLTKIQCIINPMYYF